ncbi:hypothetical protein Droror1_Dr00012580, partial [Drosera rotundifolia]
MRCFSATQASENIPLTVTSCVELRVLIPKVDHIHFLLLSLKPILNSPHFVTSSRGNRAKTRAELSNKIRSWSFMIQVERERDETRCEQACSKILLVRFG